MALTLLVASPAGPAQQGLQVPEVLKDYRSWRTVASDPLPVPYDLWIQCVHPSAEAEAKAAREHGPHDALAVQVFTNPTASSVFYAAGPQTFLVGSIVVKEKSVGSGKPPVAVAAMVKGAKGSHPESGDWEFLYVTSQGPVVATVSCVDCHRTAPSDFLFRSYPGARK
jgi:hypothetical protein